jgi:hypothetical protein
MITLRWIFRKQFMRMEDVKKLAQDSVHLRALVLLVLDLRFLLQACS